MFCIPHKLKVFSTFHLQIFEFYTKSSKSIVIECVLLVSPTPHISTDHTLKDSPLILASTPVPLSLPPRGLLFRDISGGLCSNLHGRTLMQLAPNHATGNQSADGVSPFDESPPFLPRLLLLSRCGLALLGSRWSTAVRRRLLLRLS